MSKKLPVIIICMAAFVNTIAQTTITLQPDGAAGKDAEIFSCVPCGYPNGNHGSKQEFDAIGWTNGGASSNVRSLIQFNLSAIPANATITDARFSLFFNPNDPEGKHFNTFFTPNTSYLRRITSAWDEYVVTWNNQPSTTTTNQVSLAATTSSTQNFLNINIKNFVQYWVSNPSQNFGMLFRLQTEAKYRKLIFASSDNPNAALRPKLVITYTTPSPIAGMENQVAEKKPAPAISSFQLFNRFSINEVDVVINSAQNKNAAFAIYDLSGREIKTQNVQLSEGENLVLVQTNDWKNGVYVAVLRTDEELFSEKFVVE